MRRLRLLLEYDGTNYAGWQRQAAAPSIQAILEETAASLLQEGVRVVGAGRTDAGVHALGQVGHLTTASALPVDRIREGLNALLPDDIVVREVEETAPSFHARRDARVRIYSYVILNRPRPSALLRHHAYHVYKPLDLGAMRSGAAVLEGCNDFVAFRVTGTPTATTLCTVEALQIDALRDDVVVVTIAANRFLRQMVRMIVGTLVRIGRGALAPDAVGGILGSRDNQRAGPAAPARGLYLMRVLYENDTVRQRARDIPQML